ncbi:MAG TPA: flagellar biosynthesis protein FlhB [Bacillales bacterium]|nr:flagellar biosynthesis protein FlhB [Bacillales bacterium]
MSQEKTEKATPKKRQDSRKKGQVSKSNDVTVAISLLLIFLFLIFFGSYLFQGMLAIMRNVLAHFLLMDVTQANVHSLFVQMSMLSLKAAVPIGLIAFVAALAANYMQVGFLFSTEAVQLKGERINPIQGAKKIFSVRALVELAKSVLKISAVIGVSFGYLWLEKDKLTRLGLLSPEKASADLGKLLIQMCVAVSILLIFISILDYLYQRFDHEKNMRMSKQDVKDERKNIDGDPKIKAKIRQKQQQMAMNRMMQEVPKADVVITNPTHYAVALQYDDAKMDAPVVVAKGMDLVAQRIKEIAAEHDIVTMENRSLAQSLYRQVNIGEQVPESFFKVVAEILAYVYRLKQKA